MMAGKILPAGKRGKFKKAIVFTLMLQTLIQEVNPMEDFYQNLNSLVEQNGEAKRYYNSLPYAMKQTVQQHATGIHGFDALRRCVEDRLNQNGHQAN